MRCISLPRLTKSPVASEDGLAAAAARIPGCGSGLRCKKEAEEVVAVAVRDLDNGRGLARDEAALRLAAKHRDELVH